MKIYTKTGDQGKTSLYSGDRVEKTSINIEVLGNLDELIAYLGLCSSLTDSDIKQNCIYLQEKLQLISNEVAGASNSQISKEDTKEIEAKIDALIDICTLPNTFVWENEDSVIAHLNIARTIARRTERRLCELKQKQKQTREEILIYTNRVSDLIYMLYIKAKNNNK